MTISAAGEQALTAVRALPADDQKALVDHVMVANPELWPTDDKYKTTLWMTLLIGLFTVALSAMVVVVIFVLKGKDSTAMLSVVTAVVAGVIGLFSKPPTG